MKRVFRVFLLVCFGPVSVLMIAGFAHAELPGAVAIYLLDEGSGEVVEDSSGNGNDGDFMGNPKWVDGVFGEALSFGGHTDYVDIKDSDSFDITGGITLMAWVYPNVLSGNVEGIVARWKYSGGDERSYLLATSNTNNGVRFQISPDGTGGSEKVLYSDVGLETKKWTHIACTWDGSTMKVYFDGVEHGNMSYKQDIHVGISKLNIGTLNDDPNANRVFDGIIDEVVILDRALTENEIGDIMTRGLKIATPVSPLQKLATCWGSVKTQY